MLRKSIASERLALCLISCVMGDAAPWLTDVADLLIIITGKVIVILFYSCLFENLEQFVTQPGTVSKTEGICWLSHDCVSIT